MARDQKSYVNCRRAPDALADKTTVRPADAPGTQAQLHALMRALAREAARADHRVENKPD
ncbi:hypothetical protein METH_03805 [Leisingera methylohalidivorans DSM 14336]|uniref:Uncharacterized protein n=1 Tax=Leisingera methylohalidivorans DSM 14336 TaxID=999552 RepID=V9VYQ3_9RHOB|nr:hypothetical protein METH_03805 [Leisingera methylohalidivorans DSM 14336]